MSKAAAFYGGAAESWQPIAIMSGRAWGGIGSGVHLYDRATVSSVQSNPIARLSSGPIAESGSRGLRGTFYGGGMTSDSRAIGITGASLLSVFGMISDDAWNAPTLADRLSLTQLAGEYGRRLKDLLHNVESSDVPAALAPFVAALDEIERRTAPGDWEERLIRSHIVSSMLHDLIHQVVEAAPQWADVIRASAASTGHGEFVVRSLHGPLAGDRRLRSRLSLWGRRVAGEVLGVGEQWLGAASQQAAQTAGQTLAAQHSRRMSRLGLTA